MESLHPETPVANIRGGGEAVTAARERLAKADVAALYRDDPPRPRRRSVTWSSALPARS